MNGDVKTRRYDEKKLKELEEKGIAIDWDALDAPFNLGITSIANVSVDIGVVQDAAQRVKEAIRGSGYACELSDMLIFIMLLEPDVPRAKDAVSWRRKDNAYVIRKTIEIADWQQARTSARKALLNKAVTEGILSIPTRRLSEPNQQTLVDIVSQAINGRKRAIRK